MMEAYDMDLPRQVIESIERRWAAKLQREVHAWKKQRQPVRKEACRIRRHQVAPRIAFLRQSKA
jgi:hypothetical protein